MQQFILSKVFEILNSTFAWITWGENSDTFMAFKFGKLLTKSRRDNTFFASISKILKNLLYGCSLPGLVRMTAWLVEIPRIPDRFRWLGVQSPGNLFMSSTQSPGLWCWANLAECERERSGEGGRGVWKNKCEWWIMSERQMEKG